MTFSNAGKTAVYQFTGVLSIRQIALYLISYKCHELFRLDAKKKVFLTRQTVIEFSGNEITYLQEHI